MFRRYAFTIIELLVVISIIGVLLMIAIPAYQKHMKKVIFMRGYNRVETISKKAVSNLSMNGVCDYTGNSPNFATIDNDEYLSSYRIANADDPYEGCIMVVLFKTAADGGFAEFSGKAVRIHMVKSRTSQSRYLSNSCFTNISTSVFDSSEVDCTYAPWSAI